MRRMIHKKLRFGFTNTVALLLVSACSAERIPTVGSPAVLESVGSRASIVSNEVIVKFQPGVSAENRAAVLRASNATVSERIVTAAMRSAGDSEGLTVVRTGRGVFDAIEQLRAFPEVAYAEPNYIYNHFATSNDPYYTNGSLWGMYGDATTPANQFGSQAGEAWANNHNSCGSVWVGIIDEGYMYTHEDLAANAGTNPGEIAGNGVDDDGNGYLDDVYGWDFDKNDNTVFDGTTDDHGTHVAGTIGAVGGNGIGVVGVCWSIKLFNAKFLGRAGGTTANAVKSVDYMTDFKTRHGVNMVATSNSWGGGGFSQSLQDAIERANAANILFVAAAGNSTNDCDSGDSCYPAEYPNANVIAVASLDSNGGLSSFSNWGATTIDIGAPGRGIYSTVPASSRGKIVSSYASYSGTSMATPHVSGGAALYAAYHTGASAATIKDAILSSAVPTSSLNGKVVSNGRLNVSGF